MPGLLDAKLLPKIKALVEDVGKEMVWRSWTRDGTQYDPATGAQPESSVDHNVVGVAPFDYSTLYVGGRLVNSTDGQTVKTSDMRVMFAGKDLPFTPKPGDECVVDGETWACVGKGTVYSGRSIVVFIPQMAKRG